MQNNPMSDRNAGAIVPFLLLCLFLALIVLGPTSRGVDQILSSADQTTRFSASVDRMSMTAYAIGRAATTAADGTLTPPTAPASGGIPDNIGAVPLDRFGVPFGYCPSTDYTSTADPLFALISAGYDRATETNCADALLGQASGDDIVRTLSVYEASLAPHQVAPHMATVNEMWRSQCASIGVIQNLPSASQCAEFDSLWSSFIVSNPGLMP